MVYCLPVERDDCKDDLFDVVDDKLNVVFTGSYSDCCSLIEDAEEKGTVFYL